MRKAKITDAEEMVLALQNEIRRTDESRYDHRLHGVLLVARGLSCREVAGLLGDAPRTVAYWVRRFEEDGLQGTLGVRQSQRLFRQLGFRFRKPRPKIAHADPEEQREHKKTT